MGSRRGHFGTSWALAMAHESPSRAHGAHELWAREVSRDSTRPCRDHLGARSTSVAIPESAVAALPRQIRTNACARGDARGGSPQPALRRRHAWPDFGTDSSSWAAYFECGESRHRVNRQGHAEAYPRLRMNVARRRSSGLQALAGAAGANVRAGRKRMLLPHLTFRFGRRRAHGKGRGTPARSTATGWVRQ